MPTFMLVQRARYRGEVISEADERIPHRFAGLVFLAAFPVPFGARLTNMLFFDAAHDVVRDTMVMQADGASSVSAQARG